MKIQKSIYPDQVSGASPLTCPRRDSGAYSNGSRSDGAGLVPTMATTDARKPESLDTVDGSRDSEAVTKAPRGGHIKRKRIVFGDKERVLANGVPGTVIDSPEIDTYVVDLDNGEIAKFGMHELEELRS